MTEEQLTARDYILQNEEIPTQYDLFIFNGSCETSINIRGHVDYFIAHTTMPTHIRFSNLQLRTVMCSGTRPPLHV